MPCDVTGTELGAQLGLKQTFPNKQKLSTFYQIKPQPACTLSQRRSHAEKAKQLLIYFILQQCHPEGALEAALFREDKTGAFLDHIQ